MSHPGSFPQHPRSTSAAPPPLLPSSSSSLSSSSSSPPLFYSFTPLSLHPSSPKFYFHFFPLFLKKNRLNSFCFHFLLFTSPLLFTLALLILPGGLIVLFCRLLGMLPGMRTEPGNALPAAEGRQGRCRCVVPACRFTEFAVRAGGGGGPPAEPRSLGRAASSGPGRRSVATDCA